MVLGDGHGARRTGSVGAVNNTMLLFTSRVQRAAPCNESTCTVSFFFCKAGHTTATYLNAPGPDDPTATAEPGGSCERSVRSIMAASCEGSSVLHSVPQPQNKAMLANRIEFLRSH
jgi:hypothetical protein